jgi:hypothetical protein
MSNTNFQWFIPSWYGDIRLRVIDDAHTRVEVTKLTHAELAALHALKKRSLQSGVFRRAWATEKAWSSMPSEAFAAGRPTTHHVNLKAPIGKIESFLTRQLRGKSDTVSVMITDKGSLYEIKAEDKEVDTNVLPFRRLAAGPEEEEQPKAATTVRKPAIGCPAPNFEDTLIRATEVLKTFLTPEQVEDYERHQKFVTLGGATGRRYLLTSRHALSSKCSHGRTVHDVDNNRDLCVHDWGIPAPEELLTMHLMLSLPEYEGYIHGLGDDGSHGIIEKRGVLPPPPTHYYYDMDGKLRPFENYDGYVADGQGRLTYHRGRNTN